MAKNNDSNKKLPKPPSEVTDPIDIRYTRITVSPSGTADITYQPVDPDEANNKAFREQIDSSGGYKTNEAHEKQQLNTSMGFEQRNFSVGGVSTTAEGNVQEFNNSTKESSTNGDNGATIGGRNFLAIVSQLVNIIGGGSVNHVPKRSTSPQVNIGSGDSVDVFDGNRYNDIEGDHVQTIQKNNVLMIKDGDFSNHIQSGNWDTHIAQKARLYADNDILIESATKIVLKVGTSTITITPSNIEILANGGSGRIDLNN
jgi:hypothetical protein